MSWQSACFSGKHAGAVGHCQPAVECQSGPQLSSTAKASIAAGVNHANFPHVLVVESSMVCPVKINRCYTLCYPGSIVSL